MILYHATAERNLANILEQGIKVKYDGVYLADSAKLAASFIFLRGETRVIVFEIKVPDDSVQESFDHNEQWFKTQLKLDSCRCFTYPHDIPVGLINLHKVSLWER